jgi:ssDNA thymidine ADP-ribosyltransferase, DarT
MRGELLSDAEALKQSLTHEVVGIGDIKKRRLESCKVKCYPDTMVGEYVPFYFCPRSIMLYLLHKGNHANLAYTGGQRPIVHLEADLTQVLNWAQENQIRWAFTNQNASAVYAQFYNQIDQFGQIHWDHVHERNWQDALIKEHKQAEYLHYGTFPCHLFSRIIVIDERVQQFATERISEAKNVPPVVIEPEYYY